MKKKRRSRVAVDCASFFVLLKDGNFFFFFYTVKKRGRFLKALAAEKRKGFHDFLAPLTGGHNSSKTRLFMTAVLSLPIVSSKHGT